MRLIFLGTPAFAVPSLETLSEEGFEIAAVVTQPDRPRGRERRLSPPPVKEAAERLALPVHQPERIRRPEVVEWLAGLKADAMAVVGYGQIIPQSVIDLVSLGIINVHASLLPKYRGAAPVQWAIANGEVRTGVTTMRIDAGLDTGDILLVRETAIGPEETAVELGVRLSQMGAALLAETLRGLEAGVITPRPQDHAAATLAPLLKKEDGRIDWTWPARNIYNRWRGFQPWPGIYTTLRGQNLLVWNARLAEQPGEGNPGTLRASGDRLLAACGEGSALELLEIQLEGRKRLASTEFLRGWRLAENEVLGDVAV